MTMNSLIQYLATPKHPIETGNPASWPNIEAHLGLTLPEDYKEFINNYGTVVIAEFLIVLNPFSERVQFSLFDKGQAILRILSKIQKSGDDTLNVFSLYPGSGGLLPWGFTDFGHNLCWLTNGNPDKWSSIILEPRSLKHEIVETSMASLILSIAKKSAISKILPRTRGKVFAEVL